MAGLRREKRKDAESWMKTQNLPFGFHALMMILLSVGLFLILSITCAS